MGKFLHIKYVVTVLSLLALPIFYNACSDQVAFDSKPTSELNGDSTVAQTEEATDLSEPSLVIDNGAEYTRDAIVNLTLDPDGLADKMYISNDENCASGSWEDYHRNKLWTLGQGNKKVAVYAKFRYQDQPETPCIKDEIVHDNIAPVIQFTNSVNSLWISDKNITISYQVTDSGSGVRSKECDRSGQGQFILCGNRIFYTSLQENENYLLIVRATDNAGNVSVPQQLNWRSDQTAPTVTFNITPSAITADQSPEFSFLGNDIGSGIAGYQCRLDGATQFTNCNNSEELNNLADGAHSFQVRAIDNVGRISEIISHNWTQDTMAPTIMFTQTPSATSNSSSATFSFSAMGNQDIQTYQCKVDSGSYQSCTSSHTLTNLSDGNHGFSVIGRDAAGNVSSPIVYNWLVDTGLPTVAFVETPDSVTSSQSAHFSFSAQDNAGGSGVDRIECRVNTSSFATCNTSVDYSNLSSGNHQMDIRAVDNAGNISSVISYGWTIDTMPPTVMITSTPSNPTSAISAEFSFVVNDTASGVASTECRVDGDSFQSCSSSQSYSDLSNGIHNFYVKATDNAGNTSGVQSYQWFVDTEVPSVNFVLSPANMVFIGTDAILRFMGDDNGGSGVSHYTCEHNGVAQQCDGNININIPSVDERLHTFSVRAFDNVGNSALAQISWESSYAVLPKVTAFDVDQDRPVDILFVVDNSGSMAFERSSLAQRINGFLSKVDGLDWQIAVISTDVRTSGSALRDGRLIKFQGLNNQYILDSSMDINDAQMYLGNTIQNFDDGSGDEEGIWATKRAIDRAINPTESKDVHNQNFFRSGAELAVILLSDEDEDSDGIGYRLAPADFLDFVRISFSGQKNITWHSIIVKPGDIDCKNFDSSTVQYEGVIYNQLSMLTGFGQPGGAIIGSVCESDYTAQLQDIGQSVKDMQKSISLSCEPVDDNGDGLPDLDVTRKAPGGLSYAAYGEAFQVQGQKIVFDEFLLPGDYKINYLCVDK